MVSYYFYWTNAFCLPRIQAPSMLIISSEESRTAFASVVVSCLASCGYHATRHDRVFCHSDQSRLGLGNTSTNRTRRWICAHAERQKIRIELPDAENDFRFLFFSLYKRTSRSVTRNQATCTCTCNTAGSLKVNRDGTLATIKEPGLKHDLKFVHVARQPQW